MGYMMQTWNTRRRSAGAALNRLAFSATVHCLTGCAIGEVLGMVISTAFGWSNAANIVLSILLAFVFGYALTSLPLVRSGLPPRRVARLALASDTLSITTMEIVDTLIVVLIPGALNAGLGDPLFWGSLAVALLLAGAVAFPVNRWLIARGKGHAVIHGLPLTHDRDHAHRRNVDLGTARRSQHGAAQTSSTHRNGVSG